MPTACFVVIGDELLSGKVRDTNTPLAIEALREAGLHLRRIVTLPDDRQAIAREVRSSSETFDLILTSGGVGPTHDDVTIQAVGDALARPVERHEGFVEDVRRRLGAEAAEGLGKMADLPRGAELIQGGSIPVPIVRVANVFIFPGVPEFFRAKLEVFKETYREAPFHQASILLDARETDIADTLHAVQEAHPDVPIGSYPRFGEGSGCRVLVTVESKDPARLQTVLEELRRRLPQEMVLE